MSFLTFLDSPIFVTWRNNDKLRGCIGTFQPTQELTKEIALFSKKSAFHDSRFHPITRDELKELTVYLSLLSDFEKMDHLDDWKIGTHGIRIHFKHMERHFSATFLPEVPTEQGDL